MDTLPLLVVFILIGIPAFVGAFHVTAHIARESIGIGVVMLIYAGALAAAFAIVLPEGGIASGNYLIKSPGAFVLFSLLGVIVGFIARKRAD